MNGGPDVGFKMKIRIHNEGVVEAVKKSSPPPTPPPAGDMTVQHKEWIDGNYRFLNLTRMPAGAPLPIFNPVHPV